MIILYVFGIPVAAFIILRINRDDLHEIETRRKYSFLYAVRYLIVFHFNIAALSFCFKQFRVQYTAQHLSGSQ